MISVIVYGRNDSYGYNLHKRAAISLNCIAEVLNKPGDEILFVDCNTPNEIPTFLEAIADTLTLKAKQLVRILRLRPNLYEKYKKGSPLKALEPLSRNIALRRSNPANRWILSTNTDMVFVVRDTNKSLSEVVAELPDGLYELPRFEVPGALWESVDRHNPSGIISSFSRWGQTLHLNVAVISRPEIRFDGPGDFQLMLREQIFQIDGFNEDMTLGWHVDSNLCKRLYLLNGKTESLLDHVFAYHCDHTRQVTLMHDSATRTQNDSKRFIYDVTSPYLPRQAATWGLPDEAVEEICLTNESLSSFRRAMENLLPGMAEPVGWDSYESYDRRQSYDNFHMFPFLADYLTDTDRIDTIGYFGGNVDLLKLVDSFFNEIGYRGTILVDRDLIASAFPERPPELPDSCRTAQIDDLLAQSDIYIFDAGIMHLRLLAHVNDTGSWIDLPNAEDFRIKLATAFFKTVADAKERPTAESKREKLLLLIGAQHSWFEKVVLPVIGTTVTPYSTQVRQGFINTSPARSTLRSWLAKMIFGKTAIDKIGLAKYLSRRGRNYLRAGEYENAQRYLFKAFCCQPFYGKNLPRLLLAHLWGLRNLYINYKTYRRFS